MEEKLYFKPAKYGKGSKKRKNKSGPEYKTASDIDDGSTSFRRTRNLAIFLLCIALAILVVLWLLRGRITTTGQYPANISNHYLECSSSDKHYEKIGSTTPARELIKITLVFKGSEKLNTIGLRDRLEFDTKNEAFNAEAVTHAVLGTTLAQEGLKFTEFENKFTLLDNILEVSLHAYAADITEYTASYFMLDTSHGLPRDLEEFKQNYESQNFKCASNDNN